MVIAEEFIIFISIEFAMVISVEFAMAMVKFDSKFMFFKLYEVGQFIKIKDLKGVFFNLSLNEEFRIHLNFLMEQVYYWFIDFVLFQ
jgi:hypothetical protein